ncbi:MAG: hypothetical protein MI861_02620 [Pirellulales bacterium]|nr:hypothetical protein [Pirellulales bacterium]
MEVRGNQEPVEDGLPIHLSSGQGASPKLNSIRPPFRTARSFLQAIASADALNEIPFSTSVVPPKSVEREQPSAIATDRLEENSQTQLGLSNLALILHVKLSRFGLVERPKSLGCR